MWRDFRRAFTNDSSLEGLFDVSPRNAWSTVFDLTIYLRLAISSIYAVSTINNVIKRSNYFKNEIKINLNVLKNNRFLNHL